MSNHAANCQCPGCQYLWAAEQAFKKFGPPPVIGTFEPIEGDVARDSDTPTAPHRMWTKNGWWPSVALLLLLTLPAFAQVHVRSSVTRRGVRQAHVRTNPNHTQRDNWSSKGNVNPYTLKAGHKRVRR